MAPFPCQSCQLQAAAPQLPQPTPSGLAAQSPREPRAPGFWGSTPLGASALSPPKGDTDLADGVEGPHVLEPTVGQPVGDLGAVQQPLPPSEVTVLTQHPAVGTGWHRTRHPGLAGDTHWVLGDQGSLTSLL